MAERVLLIDDSEAVQLLVRAELEADGLDVIGAPDGRAGIRMAREAAPDLILLDVSMPGLSGYEVCELLQVQAETATIPIIFLSAASEPVDRVRGLHAGADDYVTKPFTGDELRARVNVALRHRRRLEMESRRAMRDALTGLWNRADFDERLTAEAAGARRHGAPLSCVILDLDHFKAINDSYGHPFGDTALRATADVLAATCRREDGACRYGGEEFAVLCPGVDEAGAAILGERLRAGLAELTLTSPKRTDVRLSASGGVASGIPALVPLAEGARRLVAAADAALYAAKRGGRNRGCRLRAA